MTPDQAEESLIGWRVGRDAIDKQRDDLVREAHEAGVPINRIHTLTGIGRNTIYRILEKEQS